MVTIVVQSFNQVDWTSTAAELERTYGHRVVVVRSIGDAAKLLEQIPIDIIVVSALGDLAAGLEFLKSLRITHPEVLRFVAKTPDGEPRFTPALRQSAIYQFIPSPLDAETLDMLFSRAMEARELARRHRLLSREVRHADTLPLLKPRVDTRFAGESHNFEKLIYSSESMAALCNTARQAAQTDLPILIQGETGTGKELLARAIHFNSTRRSLPLMVQNCGGMNEQLLHSELFGHKRGAFTGAVSDRLGLFRAADGGTVFLDELSEISPTTQVSLLRFLQEGEVKPLGDDRMQTVKVRIISASNRSIAQLVETGQFRRDLYYRLKGFELCVPPLRDRRTEIPVLVEFFVRKHGTEMRRKVLGIAADVLEAFSAYDFPGNIRELETEVRRMVALTRDGEYITSRNLAPAIAAARIAEPEPVFDAEPPSGRLKDRIEHLERRMVQAALSRHRWNQTKAADELGLSRVGLANKIRRYALDEEA